LVVPFQRRYRIHVCALFSGVAFELCLLPLFRKRQGSASFVEIVSRESELRPRFERVKHQAPEVSRVVWRILRALQGCELGTEHFIPKRNQIPAMAIRVLRESASRILPFAGFVLPRNEIEAAATARTTAA
jgi:hypothetical protein